MNDTITVRALQSYGEQCWYEAARLLNRGVNDNRVQDAMREGDAALALAHRAEPDAPAA